MLQPENRSRKYDHLFTEIDTGRIKIPQFQRDFVWDKRQTARLIDSLIKGFPIGAFIFWKTRDTLREIRNYERFIEQRGRRVLEELQKRLEPDLEE